jgi:hypothetical protein
MESSVLFYGIGVAGIAFGVLKAMGVKAEKAVLKAAQDQKTTSREEEQKARKQTIDKMQNPIEVEKSRRIATFLKGQSPDALAKLQGKPEDELLALAALKSDAIASPKARDESIEVAPNSPIAQTKTVKTSFMKRPAQPIRKTSLRKNS